MPTTSSAPANPLKILLVGLLCCVLLFSAAVIAGVFWLHSAFNRPQKPPIRLAQNRPRPEPGFTAARSTPVFAAAAHNAILAARTNSLPGDDLFKDLVIPRLKIIIPPDGVAQLSQRGDSRRYVRATIEEGDRVYTNIAIRLKGGPGSRRPFNDSPAFTINIDKFTPGQTFHGLKKIHLNNSVQDSSYLEEKISRELFEAAGVPVPRAGHAHVTVNGREMGMYVLVEGINKQFLKRYFKDATGNVYDGKSGMDVTTTTPPMRVNSGEEPTNHTGRSNLVEALRKPVAGGARLAALEKTLDIDRFLSYMAMEMILWHWDGYTMARNNWRIFHDRQADRIVFIPQGVDQMFNNDQGPLFPEQANGMVARAVLQIPELRDRYVDRLVYIATNVFLPDAITSRIYEVSEKVEAVLAETESQAAATTQRQRANALRNKVRRRANYLQAQLFPAPAVEFDAAGTVALHDWEPHIDIQPATLSKVKDPAGQYLLQITTEEGCTASWRTTRLLDRGKYRFEARVKTAGVVLDETDPRAGAGLRISRHRTLQRNEGDKDWTDLAFEFDVAEPQRAIELVCELRANKGTIWYDLSSLRLKRL
jgi:spore coat protein H